METKEENDSEMFKTFQENFSIANKNIIDETLPCRQKYTQHVFNVRENKFKTSTYQIPVIPNGLMVFQTNTEIEKIETYILINNSFLQLSGMSFGYDTFEKQLSNSKFFLPIDKILLDDNVKNIFNPFGHRDLVIDKRNLVVIIFDEGKIRIRTLNQEFLNTEFAKKNIELEKGTKAIFEFCNENHFEIYLKKTYADVLK